MVSEFEGISMAKVWELGVINFLNDLLYLKFKADHDNKLLQREIAKHR